MHSVVKCGLEPFATDGAAWSSVRLSVGHITWYSLGADTCEKWQVGDATFCPITLNICSSSNECILLCYDCKKNWSLLSFDFVVIDHIRPKYFGKKINWLVCVATVWEGVTSISGDSVIFAHHHNNSIYNSYLSALTIRQKIRRDLDKIAVHWESATSLSGVNFWVILYSWMWRTECACWTSLSMLVIRASKPSSRDAKLSSLRSSTHLLLASSDSCIRHIVFDSILTYITCIRSLFASKYTCFWRIMEIL